MSHPSNHIVLPSFGTAYLSSTPVSAASSIAHWASPLHERLIHARSLVICSFPKSASQPATPSLKELRYASTCAMDSSELSSAMELMLFSPEAMASLLRAISMEVYISLKASFMRILPANFGFLSTSHVEASSSVTNFGLYIRPVVPHM